MVREDAHSGAVEHHGNEADQADEGQVQQHTDRSKYRHGQRTHQEADGNDGTVGYEAIERGAVDTGQRVGQDLLGDAAEGYGQLSHEHTHTGQQDHQIHGELTGGVEDIQGKAGVSGKAGVNAHHSLLADQRNQHGKVDQHDDKGCHIHVVKDGQEAGQLQVVKLLDFLALFLGTALQQAAILIAQAIQDHLGVAHAHVGTVGEVLSGLNSQVGQHAPLHGQVQAHGQNGSKVTHNREHHQQNGNHVDSLTGQNMGLNDQGAAFGILLHQHQDNGDAEASSHRRHLKAGGAPEALQNSGQRACTQRVVIDDDIHAKHLAHAHHDGLEGGVQTAGGGLIYDITDVCLQGAHQGLQEGTLGQQLADKHQNHHKHGGPVKEVVPDPAQNGNDRIHYDFPPYSHKVCW